MFDHDTLIVSYDPSRGEARGARKRHEPKPENLGDCIDCSLCVQVCPTGIDIRDGLQYECITCALCIDACDSVMEKMGYQKGLISYTSENALAGNKVHWFRPRLIGYGLAIILMITAFSYRIINRVPLELDVIRDRTALYTTNMDGMIENTYTLKIINMDNKDHYFDISVSGIEGITILGQDSIDAHAGDILEYPLRLMVDPAYLKQTSTYIEFTITNGSGEYSATSESRFLGPRTM